MSDQVQPTPPDAPPPAGVTGGPAAAASPTTERQPVPFWEGMLHWLVGRAINAALFLALALVAGILLYVAGFHWKNSVGFGLLASFLVGMFFLRQPVMQAFSKMYP